jgi:hypothetical protein
MNPTVATGAVILPMPEIRKTPQMKIRPASARASLIGTDADCPAPAGIADVGDSTMARFLLTLAAGMARQISTELRHSASMRTPE